MARKSDGSLRSVDFSTEPSGLLPRSQVLEEYVKKNRTSVTAASMALIHDLQ